MRNTLVKKNLTAVARKRIPVLRLLTDVCNLPNVLDNIQRLTTLGNGGYFCVSTVHMAMEVYDDPEFEKIVNHADLVITDGMPLVWIQKLQGESGANRIRGNDLMISVCEFAEKNKLKVGFYGGSENTILDVVKRCKSDFPELNVAFAFSPPYRTIEADEDLEISNKIIQSEADILFVGLGCPKQEYWMTAHRKTIPALMIGVGAAFDFYAGNTKEAPKWMGQLGLEWLFRLVHEPRRLWKRYILLNPRFIYLATLQLLGLKKFEKKSLS